MWSCHSPMFVSISQLLCSDPNACVWREKQCWHFTIFVSWTEEKQRNWNLMDAAFVLRANKHWHKVVASHAEFGNDGCKCHRDHLVGLIKQISASRVAISGYCPQALYPQIMIPNLTMLSLFILFSHIGGKGYPPAINWRGRNIYSKAILGSLDAFLDSFLNTTVPPSLFQLIFPSLKNGHVMLFSTTTCMNAWCTPPPP